MRRIILFLILVLASPGSSYAQERNDGIAVIVNSGVVTNSDVNDRMRLIMVSSGLPQTPEVISKLRPQVISNLIEEEIKLQEADRLKIKIEPTDIEAAINNLGEQNKMTGEQFRTMLQKGGGIRLSTLRDQIKSQLAWTKIVMRQVRPNVDVSESDIDFELKQLGTFMGKNEWQISEIFLPIEKAKDEAPAMTFAMRLLAEIRKDPEKNFPTFARQFSRAPTGPAGGDLGWVREGLLPEKLDAAVLPMDKGQITDPIRSLTGLHILWLRDVRTISNETLPNREALTQRIGNERLDRAQRRYYLELKSSAFIDERGS